jgi:hypothetical protein
MRGVTIKGALAAALLASLPGVAAADAALDTARAQWQQAGLAAYEYGYHKFCECHPENPPESVVSVRNGAVVGVRHRPVGTTVEVPSEAKNLEFYWTMDGVFDLIASAQRRGVTVRVQYDAALGFPRSIYIDYDADFIGDELDLKFTSVTPLTN